MRAQRERNAAHAGRAAVIMSRYRSRATRAKSHLRRVAKSSKAVAVWYAKPRPLATRFAGRLRDIAAIGEHNAHMRARCRAVYVQRIMLLKVCRARKVVRGKATAVLQARWRAARFTQPASANNAKRASVLPRATREAAHTAARIIANSVAEERCPRQRQRRVTRYTRWYDTGRYSERAGTLVKAAARAVLAHTGGASSNIQRRRAQALVQQRNANRRQLAALNATTAYMSPRGDARRCEQRAAAKMSPAIRHSRLSSPKCRSAFAVIPSVPAHGLVKGACARRPAA